MGFRERTGIVLYAESVEMPGLSGRQHLALRSRFFLRTCGRSV